MTKNDRIAVLINSPRSLEAFKRTGMLPNELAPINVGEIANLLREREKTNDIPKALIELRVEAAEKNRRHKF